MSVVISHSLVDSRLVTRFTWHGWGLRDCHAGNGLILPTSVTDPRLSCTNQSSRGLIHLLNLNLEARKGSALDAHPSPVKTAAWRA